MDTRQSGGGGGGDLFWSYFFICFLKRCLGHGEGSSLTSFQQCIKVG